jgi:AcrR family transcriptional regulator
MLCDVMSQRVPRDDARRRIVAATARLLASGRFRELTVEAVMAEAGLARTVFYRHFGGLPDLVLAALDDAVEAAPAAPPRPGSWRARRGTRACARRGCRRRPRGRRP